MKVKIVSVFLGLLTIGSALRESNILIVFPHTYYSHFKATSTLVKKLSEDNNVTFVSPYPGGVQGNKQITEISIEGIIEPIKDIENLKPNFGNSYWSQLEYEDKLGYEYAKQILQNENFTRLINSTTSFDLVLVEDVAADALSILSHIFKCPLVVLISEPVSMFYGNYLSDNTLWKQGNELRNAHHFALNELYYDWFILPKQNKLAKEIAPDAPSLKEHMYKTNLVLVPSFPTMGNLIPKYPNVKQIGGFHLSAFTRTLSPKLKSFFGGSEHGVIVISKNVRDLVKDHMTALYTEGELLYDVYFTSDVNAVIWHPKVILFIGDGDIYDTSSALANQVPVLSITNNMWSKQLLIYALVERGLAAEVSANRLDSTEFANAIRFSLKNETGLGTDLKQANRIIDTHMNEPLAKAEYWIKYVINFNGAPHLAPNGLEWAVNNRLVLIIIVLTLIDISLFLLFYWIIKHIPKIVVFCMQKCCKRFKNLSKKKQTSVSYIKL